MRFAQKSITPAGLCISIILFICFPVNEVKAIDIIFSQFYSNPLYLNPAFAGAKECTKLRLHYRNQPYPGFGTYSTYNINAETYSDNLSSGFGLQVLHDNRGGLINTNIIGASYAYHFNISRTWRVGMGMEAAYLNKNINQSQLVFPDQYNYQNPANPIAGNETVNVPDVHLPDFTAGFSLYKHNFYGGFSVKHLTRPRIEGVENTVLEQKYSLQAGYTLVSQQGGPRHRNIQNNELSLHIIAENQAQYYRLNYGMYWATQNIKMGAWFRQNLQFPNAIIFLVGIRQNNYQIGYSYDYSLSGFSGITGGAHELSVLLKFDCKTQNMKYRILNCPTF